VGQTLVTHSEQLLSPTEYYDIDSC